MLILFIYNSLFYDNLVIYSTVNKLNSETFSTKPKILVGFILLHLAPLLRMSTSDRHEPNFFTILHNLKLNQIRAATAHPNEASSVR